MDEFENFNLKGRPPVGAGWKGFRQALDRPAASKSTEGRAATPEIEGVSRSRLASDRWMGKLLKAGNRRTWRKCVGRTVGRGARHGFGAVSYRKGSDR